MAAPAQQRRRKVAFYGLDSGYNAVSRRAVLDVVARAALNYLFAADEIFSSLVTLEAKWPFGFDEKDQVAFRQAYQGLQELERALADKATSAAQARRFVRFVVWQHNRHIGRGTTRLGQQSLGDVLSGRFGDDYRAIAMEFGAERVHTTRLDTDERSAGLTVLTVPSPPADSVPWLLSSTGLRSFAIDLRQLNLIRFSVNGCPRHRRNMPSAGLTTPLACTTIAL